jgi:hypothetical protein
VVETTDDNFCEMWEDEALREGFGGAIAHGKNPVGEGGRVMDGKKQACLVERGHNITNGGTYEIWNIGDGHEIYVDFNPCPDDTGEPETMAFPCDLRRWKVTDWDELDMWLEDAEVD